MNRFCRRSPFEKAGRETPENGVAGSVRAAFLNLVHCSRVSCIF